MNSYKYDNISLCTVLQHGATTDAVFAADGDSLTSLNVYLNLEKITEHK